jgi:hypothetical protein
VVCGLSALICSLYLQMQMADAGLYLKAASQAPSPTDNTSKQNPAPLCVSALSPTPVSPPAHAMLSSFLYSALPHFGSQLKQLLQQYPAIHGLALTSHFPQLFCCAQVY